VDRFVRALPKGYQTQGNNGGNVSAGEKQLITIARAFLARPQLLILDEMTSSVDTCTELLIQRAMSALRRTERVSLSRTVFRRSAMPTTFWWWRPARLSSRATTPNCWHGEVPTSG
jgi:ABC-type multidrug transport system fused ATPase/permease subunit